MQRQTYLKLFVTVFAVLILDLPLISAAKQRGKQGSPTTRPPKPAQPAPNSDSAKLSYGNQGQPQGQPPAAVFNHQPPPPYSPHPGAPSGYPQNPPPYGAQPGYHQPGPGYQQAPGGQPVIVNHVQQPQSSGGLGVGSGLAIGALGGVVGGYALSQALDGDDKKEESIIAAITTTVTTIVAGATTPHPSSVSSSDNTTTAIYVTSIASVNETTTLSSNSTSNDTTTLAAITSSVETTTFNSTLPVNEPLVEQKNSTSDNHALSNDASVATISMSIVIFSVIYSIIF